MNAGVHVSVALVLPAPGVNTALCPAGSPVRSAVSEVIASPSGSEAVMPSESGVFSAAALAAGAVSTGAPSMWPIDVTVTDFEPVCPVASITVTVGW